MSYKVLWEWMYISLVQIRECSQPPCAPSLNRKTEPISETSTSCALPVPWFPLACQLSLLYKRWEITLNGTMSVMRLYLWMHMFQKLQLTFSSAESWTESIVIHLWSTQSSNEPWHMSHFQDAAIYIRKVCSLNKVHLMQCSFSYGSMKGSDGSRLGEISS